MDFAKAVRSIPDYPKPGITFRDITTLLGNARAFRTSKELFADSPHLAMPGATVEVMEITSM